MSFEEDLGKLDLGKAEMDFKKGLQDLVNSMSINKNLQRKPLDCYRKVIRLAKKCFGATIDNPLIHQRIHNYIQTYLAFVQVCILFEILYKTNNKRK